MNEVRVLGVNLFWFRRDLRIDDNQALYHCVAKSDQVLPFFILDLDDLNGRSLQQPRMRFLMENLRHLKEQLEQHGSTLYVFKGSPISVFQKIVEQLTVKGVFFNRNYDPAEIERDRQIWQLCHSKGIEVQTFKDLVLHERGEILKKDKKPYTVFTYYFIQWQQLKKDAQKPVQAIKTVRFESIPSETLPSLSGLIRSDPKKELDLFLSDKINVYDVHRDYPFLDGTSRLSAYLRTGWLSVREVYHSAANLLEKADSKAINAIEQFIRQLAWRDFYYQIMYHFPFVENESFLQKFRTIEWENNDLLFTKWCEGLTGVPIVDAGMRQLNSQGWMHNRLRMITASFLTKDLLIDWRWGERYFKHRLIDYDMPLNNGGWQWCASTGTDAQPYFRIFNPFTQSKKFDPQGDFIKRYIPELNGCPKKYIHEPYLMPIDEQRASNCLIGQTYPAPIVDHSKQRIKALNMYKRPEG